MGVLPPLCSPEHVAQRCWDWALGVGGGGSCLESSRACASFCRMREGPRKPGTRVAGCWHFCLFAVDPPGLSFLAAPTPTGLGEVVEPTPKGSRVIFQDVWKSGPATRSTGGSLGMVRPQDSRGSSTCSLPGNSALSAIPAQKSPLNPFSPSFQPGRCSARERSPRVRA